MSNVTLEKKKQTAEPATRRAPEPVPPKPAADTAQTASRIRLWKPDVSTASTPLGTLSEIVKTSVINDSDRPIVVQRIADETGMFPDELELYGFASNTPVQPGSRLVLDFAYRPKRTGAYAVTLHIHLDNGDVLDLVVRGEATEQTAGPTTEPSPAGKQGARSATARDREPSKANSDKPGPSTSSSTAIESVRAQFALVLGRIRSGATTAIRGIDEPTEPTSSRAVELLTLAASYAITAAAGGFGAALNQALRQTVGLIAAKSVADMAKRAIKDSYKAGAGGAEDVPIGSLRYQFDQAHLLKLGRAESKAMDAFDQRVVPLLAIQDAASLAHVKQTIMASGPTVESLQRRMTMVAWTNFIAQYHHGDSGKTDTSVSAETVANQGLLENKQRFRHRSHHGLLEVDVGFELHDLESGERGMSSRPWGLSLKGVGENVKKTLMEPEAGEQTRLVKDVRVNRIIRGFWIGHTRLNPPLPAISALVTPDNTITAVNKTPVQTSSISGSPPSEAPVSGEELFEMAAHIPLTHLK